MIEQDFYFYCTEILKSSDKIYRKTMMSGAEYILFKGIKALEFYEELKNKYGFEYVGWHRYILVPCQKPQQYNPSVIELVLPGTFISYKFKEKQNSLEIPELDLITHNNRQPDIIETIIMKEKDEN